MHPGYTASIYLTHAVFWHEQWRPWTHDCQLWSPAYPQACQDVLRWWDWVVLSFTVLTYSWVLSRAREIWSCSIDAGSNDQRNRSKVAVCLFQRWLVCRYAQSGDVVKDLHSESNSHDKATYHQVVIFWFLPWNGVKSWLNQTPLWRLESPNDVAYWWADWSVLTNRRVEVEQYMYCI